MPSITRSAVIQAPIDVVWDVLRDFNNHDEWHPAVSSSTLEKTQHADQIGAVRYFTLTSGEELREQLLSLSDCNYSFRYSIVESNEIPLLDYVATVKLKPITLTNETLWCWSSTFRTPADQQRGLTELVAKEVYERGFAAIQSKLSRAAGSSVTESTSQAYRSDFIASTTSGGDSRRQKRNDSESTGTIAAQAISIDRYGGSEELRYIETTAPAPDGHQVQIQQSAIGVNYIDIYCRTGFFDLLKPPGVLGMEAAGVVTAVGTYVEHLKIGQRVVYACAPVGAYCSARTMDAANVYPIPDNIDDETAAGCFLKGLTSQFLVTDVHNVQADENVLVYAPAGAVGQLLCQQLKKRGARVIGATSSEEKARVARSVGAHDVILPGAQSLEEQVAELTNGTGVDVIYDAVGRDSFAHSIAALAPRGHLISFGQASGPIGQWDIDSLASRSVRLSRPNFGHYTTPGEMLEKNANALFSAINNGSLRISISSRWKLQEASAAHQHLESRASTGSMILLPEQ